MTEPIPEAVADVSVSSGSSETGVNARDTFSLGDLCLYFLHLGTFGFGGPIALVGYMQRDLWSNEDAGLLNRALGGQALETGSSGRD